MKHQKFLEPKKGTVKPSEPVKLTDVDIAHIKKVVSTHYGYWMEHAGDTQPVVRPEEFSFGNAEKYDTEQYANESFLSSHRSCQFDLRDVITKYGKDVVEQIYWQEAEVQEKKWDEGVRGNFSLPHNRQRIPFRKYDPFNSVERVVGPIEKGIANGMPEDELTALLNSHGIIDPKVIEAFINEQIERSGNVFHNGGNTVNGKLVDGKFVGSVTKGEPVVEKKATLIGED
jgi:hypothetical protein